MFLLRRGCHGATQLRSHVLPARAQGSPGGVQSPGWSCGWGVAGEAAGGYPQPHWPAPGLTKLYIIDNKYCTRGQRPFPSCFPLVFLVGAYGSSTHPAGAKASPSLPCLYLPDCCVGALSSTLVQNRSILRSTWINNIASLGMCRVFFL